MPENRADPGSRAPKSSSDAYQIYSPQDDLRPGNRYLTELTDADGDYCVIHCTLPPGVIVPLHSHADRETFYILAGTPDAFRGDHWETLKAGEAFDAQGDIPHAWRNASGSTVSMLCVTTMRMGRFLRDITISDGSADPQAAAQRFLKLVREHGYWLASPQENAAIGLNANWSGDVAGHSG